MIRVTSHIMYPVCQSRANRVGPMFRKTRLPVMMPGLDWRARLRSVYYASGEGQAAVPVWPALAAVSGCLALHLHLHLEAAELLQ